MPTLRHAGIDSIVLYQDAVAQFPDSIRRVVPYGGENDAGWPHRVMEPPPAIIIARAARTPKGKYKTISKHPPLAVLHNPLNKSNRFITRKRSSRSTNLLLTSSRDLIDGTNERLCQHRLPQPGLEHHCSRCNTLQPPNTSIWTCWRPYQCHAGTSFRNQEAESRLPRQMILVSV